MKKVLLFSAFILSTAAAFAQSGAKWATGLNAASGTDALGTSNAFDLIFKTNALQRGRFSSSGDFFLESLKNQGNGLMIFDNNGKLIPLPYLNDPSQVLYSNGIFGPINFSASGWTNGYDIYYNGQGNVGIGTTAPQFKLDVIGNTRISGTLFTSRVVISNRVQTDTLRGGSLTLGAPSPIPVPVPTEKLTVSGDARFTGNITAGTLNVNGLTTFSNNIRTPRILPLAGDTIIRLFDSTIYIGSAPFTAYTISWNTFNGFDDNGNPIIVGGFGIGNGGTYARGEDAVAFGFNASNFGKRSIAIGSNVSVSASGGPAGPTHGMINGMVIGSGVSATQKLVNGISNSLIIGFNSTVPTVFVGPSSGPGTTGNVGIGMQAPVYKLDVCGVIRAKEMRVNLTGCDFVFENNYRLMPLNDVKSFIKQNRHLPGIDPAADMETADGVQLGQMVSKLLQKIEELTLYTIQQHEEIDLLQKQLEELKKKAGQ